ncbi:GGDEF domain-containing protein [Deinococcus humi]|uniref:Diguanylate cyclase (GGDEF)-like protein n=1 Tax=Deinococcus humi TaxID=662880 RepID=A0A7W8NDP8_9DEIO|nr:GGDEF domain-containing protein [Deinococcus humi]MBB5360973.1 diguanylate cyclase (GGDEF)-like protein [Deinococcus humi]GGO17862.1 GGDEF domain-containing protein [Deinococcus humi]
MALPSTPDRTYRRSALLMLLIGGLITSLITVILQVSIMTPLETVSLLLIVVKNAGLVVWLWRRPSDLTRVGLIELTLQIGAAVFRLTQLLLFDQTAHGLGGYSYWMVMSYLVASLVLRPSAFLLASLGQYAALIAVGAAFWWAPDIAPDIRAAQANLLLQLYLMHGTVIAFLFLQHQLRRQYVQALLQAEREANLAQVDALTGLPNRRQLQAWLAADLGRVADNQPLSLVLFDLDHFKQVNDTYGHEMGDRVLRDTALAASDAVGQGDRVGRWGGEEFLILIAGDQAAAQQVAARLRSAMRSLWHPESRAITVSCGISQASLIDTPETLLRRADTALYQAKSAGRDTARAI